MGKAQRDKGKRGELIARDIAADATGEPFRRTSQNRSAGIVGDIEPVGEGGFGSSFHWEVKFGDSYRLGTDLLKKCWEQAVRDCPESRIPVLLHTERRGVWVLTTLLGGLRVSVFDRRAFRLALEMALELRKADGCNG